MKRILPGFKAFFCALFSILLHNSADAQCPIGFSSGTEPITLVAFGSINNTTAGTGGPAYQDFTSMSTNVLQVQSYTITVQGNTLGNYTDYIRVFIDWNQNNDFTDARESYDLGTIYASTGFDAVVATANILVPATAGLGNVRMRVTKKWNSYSTSCNTAGYGQAEDYTLNVMAGSSCSGQPAPGTAAGPSAVCPGVSFALTLSGFTAATGIGIQWEADAGSGWQPILNATNATYTETAGITTSTSYRATVTCSNGGGTDVSNTVSVSVNLPTQCYCSISYPSSGGGPISFVNFSDISNTTAAAANSGEYEDFTSITGHVMQGATYPITVEGNTVGQYSEYVRVFFDWDQNGSFNDPGESFDVGILYNTTGTDGVQVVGNIPVPAGATLGNTRMRVTKKYGAYSDACNTAGWGQAEDYTITVLASNSCIGTPTPGTAAAPSTICPNTAFNLFLSGYTIAAGIDIQWESNDGGGWQIISGANTASYSVTSGITVPTDFRATVTCSNGGGQDISNIVTVAVSPFTGCYCIPVAGGAPAISNVTIAGTTLNSTTGAAPGPNYYVQYPASGSTTASLMQGITYDVSATFNGAAIASVWIDMNQDGIYDASEWAQLTTSGTSGMATFSIPLAAPVGLTGMRIRSRSAGNTNGAADACAPFASGETEDYLVSIDAAVSCSGIPTPGLANAPSSVCAGIPFSVTLSGYTVANGISVQWESNSGSGWQPILNANAGMYVETGGIIAPTDYRAVVTCSNGGGQDMSNTVSIGITPPSQCYCDISFPDGVETITLVNFAGINNATTDDGTSAPENEDFTSMVATVNQGSSYTLTVQGNTVGPYTDYIRAFIDWNQNGVLDDAGEVFDIGTIFSSTGLDGVQASASIAVPSTATIGLTRLRVTKKWSQHANACNNTGYGQAENYTLNIDFPLLIKLTQIEARNTGSRNQVYWSTAAEAQGDYFELERSVDGSHYQALATIQAKGAASAYDYWDASPAKGVNYYRLKMWDASGKHAYSKVVTAVVNEGGAFTVQAYPNPASEFVTVATYGDRGANAAIRIMDMTGRVVRSTGVSEGATTLVIDGLARGTYLLEYSDDQHKETLKITKQ